MRFREPLEDFLGSKTRVRLLRLLARYPTKAFTGREAASLAGTTPSKTIEELHKLQRHGAVSRRTVGATQLWSAVPEHFVFQSLTPAFRRERRQFEILCGILQEELAVAGVRKVVLFGSVARGEERPDSDIDLLVVLRSDSDRERAERAVARAARRVRQLFGNELSALLYSPRETLAKDAATLRRRAEREGEVILDRGGTANRTA